MSKYHSVTTLVGGIKFDSMAEARRYGQLVILERAGHIRDLGRQVPFVLAPSVKLAGDKRAKPALTYFADFKYTDTKTGEIVVEDVKSPATASLAAFRIKQHLMKHIHKIDIRITK